MLTYSELISEIEADNRIDKTDLAGEILKCPRLMTKYLKYHYDYKVALIKAESNFNQMILQKQKYYNGQGTTEEYRKRPFNEVVKNQAQMGQYIDADEELCEYREKIDTTTLLKEMCSDMIEQLKYRPTHLNTVQTVRAFESGA